MPQSDKPVVLQTHKVSAGNVKQVSKQTGVPAKGVIKMIRNFNSARLSDFYKDDPGKKPTTAPFDMTRWRRLKRMSEDAPTNSMGDSDTSKGPVRTFDPILKTRRKATHILRRFKTFVKKGN